MADRRPNQPSIKGMSEDRIEAGEVPGFSKEAWRQEIRARLQSLAPEDRLSAAEALAHRVMALPEIESGRGVLVCLSFGVEIDTWGLVGRLLSAGKRVYVPRAVGRTKQLHIHPYPCELRRLSFGLEQPKSSCPELDPQEVNRRIDVALISGLAFDGRGYRLGYGAGFFDRFLAGRPFLKVGLVYDLQMVERLPVEGHDIPMNAVISDKSMVRPLIK